MFKLTFQYFNNYDERCEQTCWGTTKDEAYKKAGQIAWRDGDGDISVVSIYDMKVTS